MRKLLLFIIHKKHWFLFIILETFALLLCFNSNLYNKALYLYVQNQIVGDVSNVMTQYTSYIDLREKNKELLNQVAYWEGKYLLKNQEYNRYKAENSIPNLQGAVPIDSIYHFDYIVARIVNINNYHNNIVYLIDKGSSNGIKNNMGVVSSTGVIGTIMSVSKHYSVVIPLINPKMQLSCSILHKGYYGSLKVEKSNDSNCILSDIPNHTEVQQGDTVITSGYSNIFPRGLFVGKIGDIYKEPRTASSMQFTSYKIKLFTNFNNLDYVYVIKNQVSDEVTNLLKQKDK